MGEGKREESERDLKKEYILLAGLRSEGNRDYHNLTLVYLSGSSILITAVAILQSGVTEKQINPLGHPISIILSVAGILLCIQMALAQGIFRTWNSYLEEKLITIEENKNWEWSKIFLGIRAVKSGEKDEGKEKTASGKFEPSIAVEYKDKWWASRMKLLPIISVSVFFALVLLSAIRILQVYFSFEPFSNWPVIGIVSVFELIYWVVCFAIHVYRFLWRVAKPTGS